MKQPFTTLPHGDKEALIARLAAGKAKAKVSRAVSTAPPSPARQPVKAPGPLAVTPPVTRIPKPATPRAVHVHVHLNERSDD